MITGHYPFESQGDSNIMELYEKISACQLVLPESMDTSLQDLLKGMLQKDPESRMCVSQVLGHSWTASQFIGIHTHLTLQNNEQSYKSILSSFNSTTMMPYLYQLFQEEIENDLKELKTYSFTVLNEKLKVNTTFVKKFIKKEEIFIKKDIFNPKNTFYLNDPHLKSDTGGTGIENMGKEDSTFFKFGFSASHAIHFLAS